eukprot:427942_1
MIKNRRRKNRGIKRSVSKSPAPGSTSTSPKKGSKDEVRRLRNSIKQYKTDEEEYAKTIDELRLKCYELTQKALLIDEAETHAKKTTKYCDKCKENAKIRDKNNKLLNKCKQNDETITLLL